MPPKLKFMECTPYFNAYGIYNVIYTHILCSAVFFISEACMCVWGGGAKLACSCSPRGITTVTSPQSCQTDHVSPHFL